MYVILIRVIAVLYTKLFLIIVEVFGFHFTEIWFATYWSLGPK